MSSTTAAMRMPPITADASDRLHLFELSELGFVAFDSLVGMVYSGTQETVPWTRLLDRLREMLGANYVTLILRAPQADQPLQVVFSGKAQPTLAASFYTDWGAIDPFIRAFLLQV